MQAEARATTTRDRPTRTALRSVGALTPVSRWLSNGARLKVGVAPPFVLIGICTVGLSAGHAQEADSLTIDIGQCVALATEGERLACYERLANAAIAGAAGRSGAAAAESGPQAVPAAVAPASAPPAVPAAASAPPVVPPAAAATTAPPATQPAASEEILSRVTEVDEFVPNRYRITLENGQVWRQMQAKRFLLRPGYEVRVSPSRWGESYRLTSEQVNGFIQVERVR